jgi:general stress protein 26
MTNNGNDASAMRKLARLVKGIRVAMLTTCAEDGSLHSRPMATREASKDGCLWFFTYSDTEKVHEIRENQRVNVTYSDPEHERYVAVVGTADLTRDRDKMEKLWSPLLYVWFPQGLDTRNIALLRVHVQRMEYWDPNAGRLSNWFERLRAAVLHTPVFPTKHGYLEQARCKRRRALLFDRVLEKNDYAPSGVIAKELRPPDTRTPVRSYAGHLST